MSMRMMAVAVVLLLGGLAVGQIIPNGNRPPRNIITTSGGGDFWVSGRIPVIDAQGRPRGSIDGVHRVFKSTGQVETFVVVLNQDGTRSGRWMPTIDVPVGQ